MSISYDISSDMHWFQCGSESSIICPCRSGSRSRVLITKNSKKLQLILLFFWWKIGNYLSLGINAGRQSYRRRLQPSKENIQHFKTWNFLIFFFFVGLFWPLRSGSSRPKLMRIHADSDPKHLLKACVVNSVFDPDMEHLGWLYPTFWHVVKNIILGPFFNPW